MHYKITTVDLTGKPQFTIKSAASGKYLEAEKTVYAGADPCDFIEEMGGRMFIWYCEPLHKSKTWTVTQIYVIL